jgi:hypothetical protein
MNNLTTELVLQLVKSTPWYSILTAAVTLASSVAAITPTPKKGTSLSKVYRVVDFLALNVGKAKQK